MGLSRVSDTFRQELISFINSYYSSLQDYPIEGEFTRKSLSDEAQNVIGRAQDRGFIEITTHFKRNADRVALWKVTDKGREAFKSCNGGRGLEMPCGCEGAGMKNLTDESYIQCTKCDGRWVKEELQ